MTKPSRLFYQNRERKPLIYKALGIYIWDQQGKKYIDGSSGAMVVNIGHGNEAVLSAMQKQMHDATFAYRLHFENEPAERLADKLSELTPDGFEKSFFVSGGSEAVESCIKLARQYALATNQASRWKIISRYPSYHGSTMGALALTGYDIFTKMFEPMLVQMPKIPAPTSYLDQDNLSESERGLRYANMLETEILSQGPETVLAFMMEPIGGASTGALVAPDSYYTRVREICDQYGVLLIYDEVMSGGGRSGRYFGGDHWPVAADIIALSKGMASGYCPLGTMLARTRLIEPVLDSGGFAHGYTYAGNPLACAAGLAVLNEIEQLDLLENSTLMGEKLKSALQRLKDSYPCIGHVRGKGLLLAVELVADQQTMEPLPASLNAYDHIVKLAYERGLIIYSRRTRGGTCGDHFMVCPPMIITAEQIDDIISRLDDALAALCKQLKLAINK